jgi:hypothetical protein
VEAVVAARLDRLPDDERDTIRRAALLGRIFRVEDLQALTGAPPERLTRALVRLAARGLIAPASARSDVFGRGPGAYGFRNLITKEVAYEGLCAARPLIAPAATTRAWANTYSPPAIARAPGARSSRPARTRATTPATPTPSRS